MCKRGSNVLQIEDGYRSASADAGHYGIIG